MTELIIGIRTLLKDVLSGQVTYLADLQTGIFDHACSKYLNIYGNTVSFDQSLIGQFNF